MRLVHRYRTLPLGLDLGTSRARIALAERGPSGDTRLLAVISRDISEDVSAQPSLLAALLDEMNAELGTRERRCVSAFGGPGTAHRSVRLPKMNWYERLRAARYEAQRFAANDQDFSTCVVRVHRSGVDNEWIVGVVSREMIHRRLSILKLARLRPIAIDHDAYALRRALEFSDAICDIGIERSSLHIYAQGSCFSYHAASGGGDVTRGIARDLLIDQDSAERRKRILGTAGAGSGVCATLLNELTSLVERGRKRLPVTRVSLVGNGARLPGVAATLEAATGAVVELPVAPILETGTYPEDVLRVAAPDWTLAASLATWKAGA